MKEKFTILIADRNPHVREFLKREMATEGYEVRLAENGREVLKLAYQTEAPDLLILDPDMPDTEVVFILKKLQNRIPALPVIIHTFISDYADIEAFFTTAGFVEKKGNSVESLKEMVSNILNKNQ